MNSKKKFTQSLGLDKPSSDTFDFTFFQDINQEFNKNQDQET